MEKQIYTELTAQQIQLVRRSLAVAAWEINPVLPIYLYAKVAFGYSRLRKLFPKDMQPQYGKLVDMLNKMILQLDNTSMLERK